MSPREFFNLISQLPQFVLAVVLVIGLFRLKQLGRVQKVLTVLLLVALAAELISRALWQRSLNNFPVFHVYAIVEFGLFMLLYQEAFEERYAKLTLKWAAISFLVFGAVNAAFFQPVLSPNTNVTTTSSVILICLSLFVFFQMLREMKYERIEKSALFWINTGVLIYFSSSFVLFSVGERFVSTSIDDTINLWTLHLFFNLVHYITFGLALFSRPE